MLNSNSRGFASDNNAVVHPAIIAALAAANTGHCLAYGDDPYTAEAMETFKRHFGEGIEVFFVFNGTAANVLGLKAATRSHHAVICADTAHIHVDECGAPERFTGCKLLAVPTADGKLTPKTIRPLLHGFGFEHHAQPRVISITQPTELGTLYSVEEIREISGLAAEYGMVLHMDGARLANAAAALDTPLKAMTADAGVDVLSFGGTKNGMMFGEAVVFFDPGLAKDFKYFRKQGMQLGSKMRFIAAQFQALLSGDLWLENARHANRMAALLAEGIRDIPGIDPTQATETNGVFARVPAEHILALQEKSFFYVWNEAISEVRWMTAFDTTEEDVEGFVAMIRETVRS
ncbi:MAG: threonine aldolase [Desulfobacterales bacterium]|nr:threonine aldolase [Desulfobacterales bacterium]